MLNGYEKKKFDTIEKIEKGVNVNIKMYKKGKITMYKKRNIICSGVCK